MALIMGTSLLPIRLQEKGVTQKQLSAHLKVSEGFISMVIKGERHLTLERAVNIAHFLECNVIDLYEWNEI